MIRRLVQWWRLRKARRLFGLFVSDADLERILRDPSRSFPDGQLNPHRVEFVLVHVRDIPAEAVSGRIGAVADVAVQEGAFVKLDPPMVGIFFGAPETREKPKGSRHSVLDALIRTFGSEVAIIHGVRNAHAGLVGSDRLLTYAILFDDHRKILGLLSTLPLGKCREV